MGISPIMRTTHLALDFKDQDLPRRRTPAAGFGVGFGVAIALSKLGATVLVNARSLEKAKAAADKIIWISTMLNSDDNAEFTGTFSNYKVVITKT